MLGIFAEQTVGVRVVIVASAGGRKRECGRNKDKQSSAWRGVRSLLFNSQLSTLVGMD
jgi:hypothetical protein